MLILSDAICFMSCVLSNGVDNDMTLTRPETSIVAVIAGAEHYAFHMLAMSLSTRSSTARNGSLHSTVR
jgi:hypothetical protein